MAQALGPELARPTCRLRAGELVADPPLGHAMAAFAGQLRACGAEATVGGCFYQEVFGTKEFGNFVWRTLVCQRVGALLVLGLVGKALVAFAHQVVCHQRRYALVVQALKVCLTVVTRIGGDEGGGVADRAGHLYRGQECALLGARAVCHGCDEDLVGTVYRSYCGVALDDSLGGGHLGAVVVCDVKLEDAALGTFESGVRRQEVTDAGSLVLQVRDALGAQPGIVFVWACRIPALVGGQHFLDSSLHAVCLVSQCGKAAASFFAGVAGQLYTINGKHVPPDQALGIAGEQDLGEPGLNLRGQLADESGYGWELRRAVTGQGHGQDVLAAGAFDASAGDHASAVGQQDDFEEHCRVIGRRAGFIVVVALMQRC